MTPEEAIVEAKEALEYLIGGECADSHMDYVDEIRLAIQALKKQIAKEPAEKTINNVKYPLCPECGRVLWDKEYYCATCGQKVNRGEQA